MHDDDKQYLADHYYDYLSMARTLLRNDEEAKDAVQEALAATMASLWVTNVHSYCCKVLRNYCRDRMRDDYLVADLMGDLPDEQPDAFHERRLTLLNRFKGLLPYEMAQLLDLHYGQGLTINEVAAKVGKSQAWVKKRIMKSLRQLKEDILNEEYKLDKI